MNTSLTVLTVLMIIAGIGFMLWGAPQYGIYRLELSGKADLEEAKWSRQIQIEEAQANLESEKLNAMSEVERAKGMAEAINIENGQLTDRYIQYLWVRNMKGDNNLIYIPTEANLPILEANRNK